MPTSQQKLQTLLQQLFRADAADLDFGIYRIINYRRAQLQNFIDEELPTIVKNALDENPEAEAARKEVKDMANQIRSALGDDVLDADDNLINDAFAAVPMVVEYLKAKAQHGSPQTRTQREDAVFNHLYTFFSRYYENGDFIPRRRYAQTERYAIPYNGQEVYLHWANRDQYYVKSSEHFAAYRFKSQGITVTFALRNADVEKDNVQGAKRFFIPIAAELLLEPPLTRGAGGVVGATSGRDTEIHIPFEYRPLTDEEKKRYSGQKQQDKISDAAEKEILARLTNHYNALAALEHQTASPPEKGGQGGNPPEKGGRGVTTLKKHLRTYTRRNSADFFIHKHLKQFLTRELDVYLKNEVIPLSDFILNACSVIGGG